MLTTYPTKITLRAGDGYQFRFVKKLNIKDSVNFANYRIFFTNSSYGAFTKKTDGSWLTGGSAIAGHDVELRFDNTSILWSLDVS